MGTRIETVAFDADDTLWHNESIFQMTQRRFEELLVDYAGPEHLAERILTTEKDNLRHYGYGVKGYALSLIETAIEVSDGKVPASVIAQVLDFAKEMLAHPVEVLPGVRETVEDLKDRYRLIVITKGDLMDQEQKIARSGLGDLFQAVEIVSEKDESTYRRLFNRHGSGPASAVMVGNSVRSDILPALAAGAFAAHVPYPLTWAHEAAAAPENEPRYRLLERVDELPGWLAGL
ncbi:MAG TPA: HAD family hydrolase [Azospirillaceae bacterium]|nr:HAD family hydrolase [Azospirillaceae bacterium]